MPPHWSILAAVVGVFLLFVVGIRLVYAYIDKIFGDMARLEQDPEFRKQRIEELTEHLAKHPKNARALRMRADLKRFDEDYAGVVADLAPYLELEPKDDAGWHELADALLRVNEPESALEAICYAIQIDPQYEEYCLCQARAALRTGQIELARTALTRWIENETTRLAKAKDPDRGFMGHRALKPPTPEWRDPLLPLYEAAVTLAENKPEWTRDLVKKALERAAELETGPEAEYAEALVKNSEMIREELEDEPALARLKDFVEGLDGEGS